MRVRIFQGKLGIVAGVMLMLALVGSSCAPANRPPVITSLTATPSSVVIGGACTIQCVASDPDGDPLQYTWHFGGGTLNGVEATTTTRSVSAGHTVTWEAKGTVGTITYVIDVTVEDGRGGTATADVHVTVVAAAPANSPPVITSLTATPSSVVIGGACTIQCVASDPDGDPLQYTWHFGGGTLNGVEATTATRSVPAGHTVTWEAKGTVGTITYVIDVTVEDSRGGTATADVHVPVVAAAPANNPPVITSLTATPSSVVLRGACTIQCVASDPDGDPLQYTWHFGGGTLNGVEATTAVRSVPAGHTVTWEAKGPLVGLITYVIGVTVEDGRGGTATADVSINVIEATPQGTPPLQ
jgi:hypothetical protein